jgi:uncharacterized protein YoxC
MIELKIALMVALIGLLLLTVYLTAETKDHSHRLPRDARRLRQLQNAAR